MAETVAATIAAIATRLGGGVGIIRISGPDAVAIAARLIGREPGALPERQMVHGVVREAGPEPGRESGRRADTRVDDVLAVAMRAPHSYTGDDVAELHGHGGAANMGRLLRLVLAAGARSAEPGEFTRRAFDNGRLDLTRAEAVVDVIEAASERALRVAQAQLAGEVGGAVESLRARGVDALAQVEASVDFPDEDLDFAPPSEIAARAFAIADDVARLAESFSLGRALRDGLVAALVGPVNAGKSSLFNALVGAERAVVAREPGTTRDYVDARVVWGGVPVTLIDTAGQRDETAGATSEAERRGIELSTKRADEADVRVVLHPHPHPQPCTDEQRGARDTRDLHIASKADLAGTAAGHGDRPADSELIETSAVDGSGLDELRAAVVERVVGGPSEADDGPVVTSERQRALLDRAARSFRDAGRAGTDGQPAEIVALELRAGVDALSEVLGQRVDEEVLDALFARFCLGK